MYALPSSGSTRRSGMIAQYRAEIQVRAKLRRRVEAPSLVTCQLRNSDSPLTHRDLQELTPENSGRLLGPSAFLCRASAQDWQKDMRHLGTGQRAAGHETDQTAQTKSVQSHLGRMAGCTSAWTASPRRIDKESEGCGTSEQQQISASRSHD